MKIINIYLHWGGWDPWRGRGFQMKSLRQLVFHLRWNPPPHDPHPLTSSLSTSTPPSGSGRNVNYCYKNKSLTPPSLTGVHVHACTRTSIVYRGLAIRWNDTQQYACRSFIDRLIGWPQAPFPPRPQEAYWMALWLSWEPGTVRTTNSPACLNYIKNH